jgi:imidazoleglycerol-phosphate dehydratase
MKTKERQRKSDVTRETKETSVRVELDLDRGEAPAVMTGIGFFDHMLSALGTHARFGLRIEARGDLQVDQHHLVEDVGITLGEAFREALGEDLRIVRFGSALVPLDDALARSVVDLSGRAYLCYEAAITRPSVGGFDTDLVREFFQAFATNARINLHLDLIRGQNSHHQIEAIFKSFARALGEATRRDETLGEVPSTKGTLSEKAARGQGPR